MNNRTFNVWLVALVVVFTTGCMEPKDRRPGLRIGGEVVSEAVVIKDPAEVQLAIQALAAKYPFWRDLVAKPASERPDMALLRMDPRSN